jgi:hypothetical protein
MTLSMALLRGLEEMEQPALLSPCHSQISPRVQLFWGTANAALARSPANQHSTGTAGQIVAG